MKVLVHSVDKPRYRTRKGEIATNVLGVCSQDMQFIYVLPGWKGSASDSRVLRNVITRPVDFHRVHLTCCVSYYVLLLHFLLPSLGFTFQVNDLAYNGYIM